VPRLLRAEGEPPIRIGWAPGGMPVLAMLIAIGIATAGLYLQNIHGTPKPRNYPHVKDTLAVARHGADEVEFRHDLPADGGQAEHSAPWYRPQ
jgi:hypothetical protein